MIIDISNNINIYKKNKLIGSISYTDDIELLYNELSKYKLKYKKVYLILPEKLYKEKAKYKDLGTKLKIRKLIIKERPLIESTNSNLLTNDASGNLIVNFYNTYSDINLISLNSVIKYDNYKYSYQELIKVVKDGIKKKLKYDLDLFTCEIIYRELYLSNKKYIEVEGYKVRGKKLTKVRIKSSDLNKYIIDYLSKFMDSIIKFMDNIYPVLRRDILDTGVIVYSNYLNATIIDKLSNKYKTNMFYIDDNSNMINTYKEINN